MITHKDDVFLSIAVKIGQLGTCDRAQVGAVITRDGRAVSWGYNGAPPGLPHCNENHHGWAHVVFDPDEASRTIGCVNATHAEVNAIAFAARQGISTDESTLYVERTPCLACARLIIAAGISRVVARSVYRDPRGYELLKSALVPVDIEEIYHRDASP